MSESGFPHPVKFKDRFKLKLEKLFFIRDRFGSFGMEMDFIFLLQLTIFQKAIVQVI